MEVTEDNIDFLTSQLKRELTIGEKAEVEGQVFIKKLAFNDLHEISKAYDWEINEDNIADSKLKSVSVKRMQAGHLLGSVCEDAKARHSLVLFRTFLILKSLSLNLFMLWPMK